MHVYILSEIKLYYYYYYTKVGDEGVPLHVCSTPSTSPSWTLDQPGTVKVGGGPR